MIEFDCPSCQRHFNLKDELAGKQARCKCGQPIAIPMLLSEADVMADLPEEDDEYRLQVELPRSQPVPDFQNAFVVETAVSVPTEQAGLLKQQIRTAITAYIGRSSRPIDISRMRVMVRNLLIDSHNVTLTLAVHGQVNHLPIDRTFTRKRKRNTTFHGGGGLLGAVIRLMLNVAFEIINAITGNRNGVTGVGECATECVADICLAIDQTLGRRGSSISRLWEKVLIARWVGAGGSCVGTLVFSIAMRGISDTGTHQVIIMNCLIVSPCIFFAIHCAGLSVMPTSFLRYEPLGQRAMARAGVRSVIAMRVLTVVLAAILVSIAVGFGGWMLYEVATSKKSLR